MIDAFRARVFLLCPNGLARWSVPATAIHRADGSFLWGQDSPESGWIYRFVIDQTCAGLYQIDSLSWVVGGAPLPARMFTGIGPDFDGRAETRVEKGERITVEGRLIG